MLAPPADVLSAVAMVLVVVLVLDVLCVPLLVLEVTVASASPELPDSSVSPLQATLVMPSTTSAARLMRPTGTRRAGPGSTRARARRQNGHVVSFA